MQRFTRKIRPLLGVTMALLACSVAADEVVEVDHEVVEVDHSVRAGIDAWDRGDLIGAMAHYQRAADAGSPVAQAKLAWIHDNANDDGLAVRLYRASALQDHADGQFGLGEMYAKGEGVEKDPDKAVEWFIAAATGGHVQARRVLANAYEVGALDRKIDEAEALRWLQLAADEGDAASMRRLATTYREGGLGVDPDASLAQVWQDRFDSQLEN